MASMQVPFSEQNYVISTAVSCRRTTGVIPSGIFILLIICLSVFVMMKKKLIPVREEYPCNVFLDKALPLLIKAVLVIGIFSIIVSFIRANL